MKYSALDDSQFKKLKDWSDKSDAIPSEIAPLLKAMIAVYSQLLLGKKRAYYVLLELRKAMGLIPKSQRGSQLDATVEDDVSEANLSEEDKKRLQGLEEKKAHANKEKRDYESQINSIKKKNKQKSSRQAEFDLKDGHEAMFSSSPSEKGTDNKGLIVERKQEFNKTKGLRSTYEKTQRVDLSIVVKNVEYSIETVTDIATGKRVRASTLEVGPDGYQMTWRAIVNLIKMHVGFAIPINRISLMIGEPEFSSSKICRVLEFSAQFLFPMYICLSEEISEARVIWGDDTSTKVLETNAGKANAEQKPSDKLFDRVAEKLPWAYQKKNGEGEKTALNVSLLIGKTEFDPRSTIRFYRSHFGSVGNLLSQILEFRSPKSGPLLFQGDLSSTNRPNPELLDKYEIKFAGCGFHARQDFWKYREEDPILCYFILRAFACLAGIESRINSFGRTRERVLKYRQRFGEKIWGIIKRRCIASMTGEIQGRYLFDKGQVPDLWPKGTEIYKACNYVVKNYEALTLYLNHPELKFTNNLSERAVRIEKIMLDSSKFRKTQNGRVVIDILRTVNATCTAAGIDILDYIRYLYVHRDQFHTAPEEFTPFKVAQKLQK